MNELGIFVPNDDEDLNRRFLGLTPLQREKKRGSLPKHAVKYLKGWLETHHNHPYPSEKEKEHLLQKTGISTGQLCNWFINARRRILPKLKENIAHSKKGKREKYDEDEEDEEDEDIQSTRKRTRNHKRKRCEIDGSDSDYEYSE